MTIQLVPPTSNEKLVLVLAVILFLFVGAAGYYFGTGHSDAVLEKQITDLMAKIKALTEQVIHSDAVIAQKDQVIAINEKDIADLQAKNNVLEGKNTALLAENAAYKNQIKQMADIQLAKEMSNWIGPNEVQVFVLNQWHFSLTRLGGEKTVSIFKDAQTYFTLAENRLVQLNNEKAATKDCQTALEASKDSTKLALFDRDQAMGLLTEAKGTIHDLNSENLKLNRKLTLSKWKNTGIGIAAGVAIGLVVHSLTAK